MLLAPVAMFRHGSSRHGHHRGYPSRPRLVSGSAYIDAARETVRACLVMPTCCLTRLAGEAGWRQKSLIHWLQAVLRRAVNCVPWGAVLQPRRRAASSHVRGMLLDLAEQALNENPVVP